MGATINRISILLVLMLHAVVISYAQSTDWNMENGKAVSQKLFSIPGKDQHEIYKSVNKWLVRYFSDPEENLKARIEDEYLRGVGYCRDFIKPGAVTSADLRYTFIFEVGDGNVVFKLTNAVLIYSSTQETDDGVYPVEEYFKVNSRGKKMQSDNEKVIAVLADFSNSLFQSFEASLGSASSKL